ncbi:MAG: hypothetical protein KC431_22735, partial [Myxococcales bacterium]|nr:hypothetical protein [Myxococcales bacterium]
LPLPAAAAEAASAEAWLLVDALPNGTRGELGLPGPALELTPVGKLALAGRAGSWTVAVSLSGEPGSLYIARDRFLAEGLSGGSLRVDASLQKGDAETPALLLGADAGTRFELRRTTLAAFLDLDGDVVDYGVRLDATGGRLVIAGGDGDGFLAEVLGEGLAFDFDLGLGWSRRGGLSLSGSAGLEVTIPLGLSIAGGAFELDHLTLALRADEQGLRLDAGVAAGLKLGPFAAVVDGVGLRLALSPAPKDDAGTGNLGPVDLSLAFKPPTALGLRLDAGFARGGGFLEIDADAGRYAGILDLDLLGVGITAIGILNTKLPNSSGGSDKGWSLLLSLTARFTGLQLGFGFTLEGVGGLIGLHRAVDTQALADGVRSGALASVLFPDDPVGDAPRILADLEAVFPATRNQHVFGPVVKIGWGTPTLISLELGVIMQLPEPLTISLLGSLSTALPDAKAPILILNADFAGTLDLSAGTMMLDAALRDSSVAGLTLTGAMAMRAGFGGASSFLLAFGGFHPKFRAPESFPTLPRLGIALGTGDAVQVQLGGYFALTSNTVQFGAEAHIHAKAMGFVAEGGTSFHALIQFSPFHFRVDLEAWVSIRAGKVEILAVRLAGSLSGPNPWHVVGSASFKVLGVQKRLRVEAEFGRRRSETQVAAAKVGEMLREALGHGDA